MRHDVKPVAIDRWPVFQSLALQHKGLAFLSTSDAFAGQRFDQVEGRKSTRNDELPSLNRGLPVGEQNGLCCIVTTDRFNAFPQDAVLADEAGKACQISLGEIRAARVS